MSGAARYEVDITQGYASRVALSRDEYQATIANPQFRAARAAHARKLPEAAGKQDFAEYLALSAVDYSMAEIAEKLIAYAPAQGMDVGFSNFMYLKRGGPEPERGSGPMPTPGGQASTDDRTEGSLSSFGETLLARAKVILGLSRKGLSEQAREKMIAIKQASSNASAAVRKCRDNIEDLKESLAVIDRNISTQSEYHGRHQTPGNKEPVILSNLRDEAEIVRAEIKRLQTAMADSLEISSKTQSLSAALFSYVGYIKDGARSHTIAVEPKLLSGESQADAVNRLRRRQRELKSDLDHIRFASWPSSEAKKLARSHVDALVERGRPNVFDLINNRGQIAWPTVTTQQMSMPVTAGQDAQLILTTVHDDLAIMAWLDRDAMVARLDAEIDSCSDDSEALTAEQRATKTSEVLSDMLAGEREEEVLIERMEASGSSFLRRTDADPRAVLGLSSEMPAPRDV
jgi:hypothetical protein